MQKNLKRAIILHGFMQNTNSVERHAHNLIENLEKRGYSVEIFNAPYLMNFVDTDTIYLENTWDKSQEKFVEKNLKYFTRNSETWDLQKINERKYYSWFACPGIKTVADSKTLDRSIDMLYEKIFSGPNIDLIVSFSQSGSVVSGFLRKCVQNDKQAPAVIFCSCLFVREVDYLPNSRVLVTRGAEDDIISLSHVEQYANIFNVPIIHYNKGHEFPDFEPYMEEFLNDLQPVKIINPEIMKNVLKRSKSFSSINLDCC